jgi:hypothetical protein
MLGEFTFKCIVQSLEKLSLQKQEDKIHGLDEARKLRKEGKIDEAKALSEKVYGMMKFADQKVGILPEWAYVIPEEQVEDTTTIPDCV